MQYSFSFLKDTHIFTQISFGLYKPKKSSSCNLIQTIETKLNVSSIFIDNSNNMYRVTTLFAPLLLHFNKIIVLIYFVYSFEIFFHFKPLLGYT